jgi:hypothetical protein
MSSSIVPWQSDPIRPERPTPLHITVDGTPVEGLHGQSIAGILLAQGRTEWRTTVAGRRRGVFCGIGVCFDCIATVNGESDVRLCMRRARDGDAIETQSDAMEMDAGSARSSATRVDEVAAQGQGPARNTAPAGEDRS